MDSDHGKLFVGGIPWETTEQTLKDYFGGFGEVVDVVIMKDRITGRARGFGFVVFADPSVTDRVLMEKHTIDGRAVETKKAVPREEQQNNGKGFGGNQAPVGQIRTKKIFVGGLASTVTEEDFRTYFKQFGNITDVVVMYDHNTQRHRGFGFITYDSEDAVERVLQKSFHELNEKTVEVKRAVPKDQAAGQSGRGGGGMNNFGAGGGRGAPYNANYSQNYGSRPGSGYGGPSPTIGRGAYPPSYGAPGGYPSAGYGAPGAYPPAMNGGFGAPGYGNVGYGGMAPYGGGYGNAAGGYAGGGNVGYGGAPAPGSRSPWGGANVGSNYPSGGSPANYGASGASGGYGQANYGNTGFGYGSGESGYGSTPTGGGYGGPRGSGGYGNNANAPSAGYTDNYGNSHSSPAAASGGGYGSDAIPVADGSMNGQASYGGYGVSGKQNQRGPDRFRPYPAAG